MLLTLEEEEEEPPKEGGAGAAREGVSELALYCDMARGATGVDGDTAGGQLRF